MHTKYTFVDHVALHVAYIYKFVFLNHKVIRIHRFVYFEGQLMPEYRRTIAVLLDKDSKFLWKTKEDENLMTEESLNYLNRMLDLYAFV